MMCQKRLPHGLTDLETLPFLKHGVQVNYTGSIDKAGGNNDASWWLYRRGDTTEGEWVIFDVEGPGCIHQLYNHRGHPGYAGAPGRGTVSEYNAPDTLYRFYFDDAVEPQFTIKASEFGVLSGFEAPLTDTYLNWVKRTWFPMFFRRNCRITTSAQLLTPPGGWGSVVYHSFTDADGIPSFHDDLPRLKDLARTLCTPSGQDPKPVDGNISHAREVVLKPGECRTLLDVQGSASIASCALEIKPYHPDVVRKVRIRIFFDMQENPSVDVPLGAFFGNLCGETSTPMVLRGMRIVKDGETHVSASGYNFFPMPFWKAARVEVSASVDLPREILLNTDIQVRPKEGMDYPEGQCGYFRAVYREPYVPVDGEDTEYASIRGTGHVVGCTFASRATCEEDFRFYLDGCATARIESDGAESWAGFGWGFAGPYSGPLTCQDRGDGWMQSRDLPDAYYPFFNRIDVRQENIWYNVDWKWMVYHPVANRGYHGAVFYYGVDQPTLVQTDAVDIANMESERTHDYRSDGEVVVLTSRYEGCCFEEGQYSGGFVLGEMTDTGRSVATASEFTVAIRPDNVGVRLRRRSDQMHGRQCARVFVDDVVVSERTWYRADRNPFLRWLDDEYEIPARYTRGKDKIRVRLEFIPATAAQPTRLPACRSDSLSTSVTNGRFGHAFRGASFRRSLRCRLEHAAPEFTVDCWVRFPNRAPGLQHILSWDGLVELLADNGHVAIRTGAQIGRAKAKAESGEKEGASLNCATDDMIADGDWHHVSLAVNATRLCLHVDGRCVIDEGIISKESGAASGILTVGYRDNAWRGNLGMDFDGDLDELRINSGFHPRSDVPTEAEVTADTLALWRFDDFSPTGQFDNVVATGPALVPSEPRPAWPDDETLDVPATAWSEFFYTVFSHVPLVHSSLPAGSRIRTGCQN